MEPETTTQPECEFCTARRLSEGKSFGEALAEPKNQSDSDCALCGSPMCPECTTTCYDCRRVVCHDCREMYELQTPKTVVLKTFWLCSDCYQET